MGRRALVAGMVLWLVGTLVFRFGGSPAIPPPSLGRTVPVFIINGLIAMVVARILLAKLGIPPASRPAAVTLLILPTLLLDPFATTFFPVVFPNLPPAAAPSFGGLMLMAAGGAVLGAWLR